MLCGQFIGQLICEVASYRTIIQLVFKFCCNITSAKTLTIKCYHLLQVFIYGLYSTENNHNMVIGRLVRSLAIDPNYYKSGSGRRFITGEKDERSERTED
jgi:hypothetical protein